MMASTASPDSSSPWTAVTGTRMFALTPALVRDREVVVNGKRRFLIATRQLSFRLRAQAELPDAFLETDGGTLWMMSKFASTMWAFPLGHGLAWEPVPGHRVAWNHELARHPLVSPEPPLADAADFFMQPPPAPVVREYYHARLDRYFLATTQREEVQPRRRSTFGLGTHGQLLPVAPCRLRVWPRDGSRLPLLFAAAAR